MEKSDLPEVKNMYVNTYVSTPMPPEIGKAIVAIATEVEALTRTNDKGDHKSVSVHDVYRHVKPLQREHGVTIKPIEIKSELVDLPTGYNGAKKTYYAGTYKFRYIHTEGVSWVDDEDIRTQHVEMKTDGTAAQSCQSMALKGFLLGLYQIPTSDPDPEMIKSDDPDLPRPLIDASHEIMYGKLYSIDDMGDMDAKEVLAHVEIMMSGIASGDIPSREVEGFLMRNDHEIGRMQKENKPTWLRVMKALGK